MDPDQEIMDIQMIMNTLDIDYIAARELYYDHDLSTENAVEYVLEERERIERERRRQGEEARQAERQAEEERARQAERQAENERGNEGGNERGNEGGNERGNEGGNEDERQAEDEGGNEEENEENENENEDEEMENEVEREAVAGLFALGVEIGAEMGARAIEENQENHPPEPEVAHEVRAPENLHHEENVELDQDAVVVQQEMHRNRLFQRLLELLGFPQNEAAVPVAEPAAPADAPPPNPIQRLNEAQIDIIRQTLRDVPLAAREPILANLVRLIQDPNRRQERERFAHTLVNELARLHPELEQDQRVDMNIRFEGVPAGGGLGIFDLMMEGHGTLEEFQEHLQQFNEPVHVTLSEEEFNKIPEILYMKLDVSSLESSACAICTDTFNNSEQLKKLPCDHLYHSPCIKEWLTKTNHICPVCRHDVQPPKK